MKSLNSLSRNPKGYWNNSENVKVIIISIITTQID